VNAGARICSRYTAASAVSAFTRTRDSLNARGGFAHSTSTKQLGVAQMDLMSDCLLLSTRTQHGTKEHSFAHCLFPSVITSSFQSRNIYFISGTSSQHWKSKVRHAWGPKKRFSTIFLSGMNPMISSRNCTLQQSSVNCRDQCVRMKVSLQNVSARM